MAWKIRAWKIRIPLLLGAVALAGAASPVSANFQYDLRLAPGQPGEVNPHNVTLTGSSPITYTLQLWGKSRVIHDSIMTASSLDM